MRIRTRLSWIALVAALGGGCVSQTSIVKTRFQHDFGCRSASVTEIGGASYEAEGCGERATYSCTTNSNGWDESTCIREPSLQQRALRHEALHPDAKTALHGKAFRRYDEEKKLQVVQADFRPAGALSLRVIGAPQAQLGDILVQVDVLSYKVDESCETVEARINDAPVAGTDVATSTERGTRHIAAHFDFQQLKPLAHAYPSFGVKHCKLELKLSDADVAELRKFLVMYSDIAKEAQNASPTATEATPAGAQEL